MPGFLQNHRFSRSPALGAPPATHGAEKLVRPAGRAPPVRRRRRAAPARPRGSRRWYPRPSLRSGNPHRRHARRGSGETADHLSPGTCAPVAARPPTQTDPTGQDRRHRVAGAARSAPGRRHADQDEGSRGRVFPAKRHEPAIARLTLNSPGSLRDCRAGRTPPRTRSAIAKPVRWGPGPTSVRTPPDQRPPPRKPTKAPASPLHTAPPSTHLVHSLRIPSPHRGCILPSPKFGNRVNSSLIFPCIRSHNCRRHR